MKISRLGLGLLTAGLAVLLGAATAVADQLPPARSGTIVFSSDRAGPWRIWTIRADGTGLRQLTQAGPAEHDVDPVFSPDGKQLLFSSTRGGATGVWQAAADGSNPRRVCDGDQAEWSPDARRIAYRRAERIWVRDLAGGQEQSLTPADWPHCSGPAWSRDGQRLAFACRWDAGNGLYLLSVEGGQPIKVYDRKPACEPHWAPDGKRLVYETETAICTIQPDGKKNRPVTYFGGVQRYGRYSSDGQWIVYCQGSSERGPWELYVIAAQGGEPIPLTTGGSDMNPDWR